MKHFRKIFYVIDPTTEHQQGLGRVIDGAHALETQLHLQVCVPPSTLSTADREKLREVEANRYRLWLEHLAEPARKLGVDVTVGVDISDDWRAAIVENARREGAELIVKSVLPRSRLQRRLHKTSDWVLLRSAPCPVLFIKNDEVQIPKTLVAAVDIRNLEGEGKALADAVLFHARGIAESTGAQLQVVHAYPDQMHFVYPSDLAQFANTDVKNVRAKEDSPEHLLSEVLTEVADPVVVIGSTPKRSFGGKVLGNTAERILDRVSSDILVVVNSA